MSEMTRWQAERLFGTGGLLERLRPLGKADAEEIERICQKEVAAWRERPTMNVVSSLQEPMKHARHAIAEHLPLTEDNRWLNPKTKQYEHIARQYMNFTREEWRVINAESEERFGRRLKEQQQITDPDALVRKAEELLQMEQWYNVALGVALATGRRLTEVLKTGEFHPKTPYTLWFKGQLKTKEHVLPAYEIPTLVRADHVLSAMARLRSLQDCSQMSNDAVNEQFGPTMRQMADRHLSELLPKRSERVNLFTHLARSIYGRLCVLYFCPPATFDLHYIAHILGHYWYFEESDQKQRENLDSTLHYFDYVIGDGHGNVDGRRGIWLGTKSGVEILDAFKPKETAMKTPVGRTGRSFKKQEKDLQQHTEAPKNHSIIRCDLVARKRFDAEQDRRALSDQSQVLTALLDETALFQQMIQLLHPFSEELGTAAPLETLRALIEVYRGEKQDLAVSHHLEEHWGVSLADVDALFEKARQEGYEQPLTHFEETLGKRESYKVAAQKRAQRYQRTDFTRLPFSQLESIRSPEAAQERVRRIVLTLMKHNQHCDPRDRWFINAATVYNLKAIRHDIINAYLAEHKKEIDCHHQELGIELKYNRKINPITEMITLPDEPMPDE